MGEILNGPWSHSQIDDFLIRGRFPLRLACTAADGYPRVVSLWYRYEGGELLCVTHQASHVAKLCGDDPRVGFEVSPNEPPYHGVRGQGDVSIEPLGDKDTLETLLGRYLGGARSSLADWLLSRSDEELLLTIKPRRMFSWDYRERMADAV
jgi:hypothetical protein